MPAPTITVLPDVPLRSEPWATFTTKADAFLGAFPTFRTELLALSTYLQSLAPADSGVRDVSDNVNAAFRITQRGTGLALLVEDSVNPDASPFAVTAGGDLLAGTLTHDGVHKMQVVGQAVIGGGADKVRIGSYAADPGGSVDSLIGASVTSSGSGPFSAFGNLVIRPRTDTGFSRHVYIQTGNDGVNTFVFTNAGKLGVNEDSPDYQLDVNGPIGFTPGASVTPADNGDVVFQLTSNTSFTVKAKGSDGTVRSGSITLA